MTPEGFEKVSYEVADGIATVTLDDPEKRNMLSGQMLTELVAAMEEARDSEAVAQPLQDGERLEHGGAVDDQRRDLGVGIERAELGLVLITRQEVEQDELVGDFELDKRVDHGRGAGDGCGVEGHRHRGSPCC